jgi:hypothetical protein
MHRLLPNRVAGRRESRDIESAHGHSADRRVAVPFPIERAAAIRAEMKSNAITAVGIALVNLPLTVEPHPIFRITRTEMESGASPTLARLAMAQIHPIGFTRGNYSKRAAVALPGSVPSISSRPHLLTTLADLLGCCRAGFNKKPFRRTSNSSQRVQSRRSKNRAGGRELRRAR